MASLRGMTLGALISPLSVQVFRNESLQRSELVRAAEMVTEVFDSCQCRGQASLFGLYAEAKRILLS